MDPFEAELAREAIDAFCSEFGKEDGRLSQAYRDFARHAALPLTFNADLLYRLQERFRRDMRGQPLYIPWIAVADLMLSHLCQTVRPETFRLKETVRLVLLEELQADHDRFWSADGQQNRLQEIAEFLIQYATHQLNHPSHYVQEAAKAQRLNAQIITQPELVRQSLQETAASLLPQQDPVGALRLASLVDTFAASVNLTRADTDQTRQDFSLLQTYTAGQAKLAQGEPATAVAQQFQTTFGSDNNIQIAGQTLPGLQQLTNMPATPTLPASLGVAFTGDDVTLVLHKDTPLPATSDSITLRNPGDKFAQGLGFLGIQVYQGESTSARENYQLADILIDEESLYSGDEIEVEITLTAALDGIVQIQLAHPSGFHREATVTMVDPASLGEPGVIDFGELLERHLQGVMENSHLAALTAVSNWLNVTDADRTCVITGEPGIGKTTVAALLAQYFRGDRQPPNDLYALAPTSTSAVYFCQPSRPETLEPRSFALTIASQWASRDSNFAYLQSTIDNHEEYELDELIEHLLIKPFSDIDELIYPGSIIFLVDDLEAALQYPGETTIVDVILRMLREVYGVRFLLTAQMQTAVRSKLADIEARIYELPPYFKPIFNFSSALNAMPQAVPGFTELLSEVDAWLANPEAPQHGGIFPEQYTGKSAAAANLVKYSQGLLQLPAELTTGLTAVQPGFIAAYHLYQSTDPRTMNPRCFIQSVAVQLANKFPAYNTALREIIENFANELAGQKAPAEFRLDDDDQGEGHPQLNVVNQMGVAEAFDRLIIQPWLNINQNETILILIDGLDDMLAYEGATSIPALLSKASLPAFLHFFLAANENPTIVSIFTGLHIQNFRWEQFEGERPSGTRRPDSKFIADLTIPDDVLIQPEETFTKIWQLRNTGERNWSEGFRLTFVEGEPMTTLLSHPVPTIQPGEEARISISLTAPTQSGPHVSVWRMQDDQGIFFGDHVWAKIIVDETAAPPEPAPTPDYDNFDIHVGLPLPGPDMRYPIQVTASASGQSPEQETYSPVAELGYERLARLRDLASNPEEAIEIGQKLFNVIMREPNYEMAQKSLAMARERGKEGLRVRLQFDDPVWQSYPWELCHDGRSFIFNNPDQPILLQRTVPTDNPQTPPPLPRPVRLLVAIAAPVDQGRNDVAIQEKVIHVATEEVVTSSELDLQIIRHATLGQLDQMVASYQPSIVQFIGHSRSEKEGVLILENDSGRSNLVPVPEITRILAAAPVQCVILSPIGVGETAVSQLAPQFIQQGIPTVLAEQFVLPDQPAIEYLRTFYRALLFDRLSIEEAVWNGRNHLATTHREPFWSHIGIFSGQPPSIAPAPTSSEGDTSTVAGNEEQQTDQKPEISFSKLSIVPLTSLHFEEARLKPDYKIRTDIFLNRHFLASMQLNVQPGSLQPLEKIVVHMLFEGVENAKPTIEAISPLEFENFSLKTLLAKWGNLNENESIAQSSSPANNVKSAELHINDSAYEWEFDKALPQEGKSVQFAAIVKATANMDALNMNLHASLEFAPNILQDKTYEAREKFSFSLRDRPFRKRMFVDRESKIRDFIRLLEPEVSQTLMLIEATKDMGKSWLLQELHAYCLENEIPVALIDCKNPRTMHKLQTVLDILRLIRDRLDQPLHFNNFNKLVNRVTSSEDFPHQETSDIAPENPDLIVDNRLPIIKYESVQEQAEIKKQLTTSFFECMTSLLQEKQTAVLLMDSYEGINSISEDFLLTELLPYLTNKANQYPGKFVVIIAGRQTPDVSEPEIRPLSVQTGLEPFGESEVREYFEKRSVVIELDYKIVLLTSGGVPGALAMMADHAVTTTEADDDFFADL